MRVHRSALFALGFPVMKRRFTLIVTLFSLSLLVPSLLPTTVRARDFDPIQAIEAWNADLSSEDRAAKYCKMSAAPLAFYRGSNHLFWADLAHDARLAQFGNEKTRTWIQGDLHLYNYGAFDDDSARIVYGLNDFDESLIADYQYDIWRMAVSLVLAARETAILTASEQAQLIDTFSETYLDTLAAYRGNDNELKAVYDATNTYGRLDDFLLQTEQDNSRIKMLDKWTVKVNGERRFDVGNPKLETPSAVERDALIQAMPGYGLSLTGGRNYDPAYFRVKDAARRLFAGTGSLGTPRFYLLIEGATASEDDDRILDVKRQGKPAAYYFLDTASRAEYDAAFALDAQRHALAMNALTKHTDDHLGFMTLSDGGYSVRERSPYKEAFPLYELTSLTRWLKLGEQWGHILASRHAGADKDFEAAYVAYSLDKQVDVVTNGNHAAFRGLVRDIAFGYADQVESDWRAFTQAYPGACAP